MTPTQFEAEIRAVLDTIPNAVIVREGAGPENIAASLAVSVAKLVGRYTALENNAQQTAGNFAKAEKRAKDAEAANERDRTNLHKIVSDIECEIRGRLWLLDDGRGCYEWDDERYQKEFGWAAHALLEKIAALRKISGDLTNCPTTQAEVEAARRNKFEEALRLTIKHYVKGTDEHQRRVYDDVMRQVESAEVTHAAS